MSRSNPYKENFKTNKKLNLKGIYLNHTPPSTFNCPICQEQFPNENARFNHLSNDQCQCHHQLPEILKTSCLICQRDLLTVSFILYYFTKTINILYFRFGHARCILFIASRVIVFCTVSDLNKKVYVKLQSCSL